MDYLKSNNLNALINKIKNDPNFSEDLQKPSKFSLVKSRPILSVSLSSKTGQIHKITHKPSFSIHRDDEIF